jgi:transcription initiation factor TFIIA large subunit
MQQQYGQAASASVNAMQRGGGLALPGGQQSKPQMHIPAQSPPLSQQPYAQQQAVRQQQQFQQQQPQIKLESDSPHLPQQGFTQQTAQPNYNQTDGADDAEGLDQWRTMLAQRRAIHAAHSQQADHLMRDSILQHYAELQSGLMMPLDDLPSNKRLKCSIYSDAKTLDRSQSSIPQMDGNLEDEDEDEKKVDVKDESDEDAINSGKIWLCLS